jgi:hypothetical protein
LAEEWLLESES